MATSRGNYIGHVAEAVDRVECLLRGLGLLWLSKEVLPRVDDRVFGLHYPHEL